MKYLLLFFLFSYFKLFPQFQGFKAELEFKDDSSLTDQLVYLNSSFKSLSSGNTYSIDLIKSISISINGKKNRFYFLELASQFDDQIIRGVALKIYENNNIEVYKMFFGNQNLNTLFYSDDPQSYFKNSKEIFARKKTEAKVYNIAFKDGRGWKGLHTRLKLFFKDCPKIFSEMKKNKISKKETLKIVDLYQELCN